MQPIVLHLDMNSYFASVEQQDYPQYRGRPLGVCEHLGGIIIAASREAKRWGIKTGTPVWEAQRLYPKIILTKTHPDRYRFYTTRFVKVVQDYTDMVEKYSIDEVFLDISRVCNVKLQIEDLRLKIGEQENQKSKITNLKLVDPFEEAVRIAGVIKRRMKKEVGDWLTCSIGIAENKLLAKIASDLKKPDGVVVVTSAQCIVNSGEHEGNSSRNSYFILHNSLEAIKLKYPKVLAVDTNYLYKHLSLTDIPGIGTRQAARLETLGIKTLVDLRDCPYRLLVANFGILGHHLHSMGQLKGTWRPKVLEDEKIKSIGHMYTLPRQFREKKFFVPVLYKLCEMVARRMREQGLTGSILHFHLHDSDYNCFGQSKKLGYWLNDGREIFLEAMIIFDRVAGKNPEQPSVGPGTAWPFPDDGLGGLVGNGLKPFPTEVEFPDDVHANQEFKLIGITMSGLQPETGQQSLFKKEARTKQAVKALDTINEKYGDFTICRVPVLGAKEAFHDSIGFGRLKEFSKW